MGVSLHHDIGELLGGLRGHGLAVPGGLDRAAALTRYATGVRYPGVYEPATDVAFSDALGLAREVVAWAEHLVSAATPDVRASGVPAADGPEREMEAGRDTD